MFLKAEKHVFITTDKQRSPMHFGVSLCLEVSQNPNFTPVGTSFAHNENGTMGAYCAGTSMRRWREYDRRWLTVKEKCASMYLPTYAPAAAACGLRLLDYKCLTAGHRQLGNGINVGAFLAVMAAVLCSVRLCNEDEPPSTDEPAPASAPVVPPGPAGSVESKSKGSYEEADCACIVEAPKQRSININQLCLF